MLTLGARGRTNADLFIGLTTARTHVASLLAKIGARKQDRDRDVGLRHRPGGGLKPSASATSGEAVSRSPCGRFRAVVGAEPSQHIAHVMCGGLAADVQPLGDLRVAEALGHECKNFLFSIGEQSGAPGVARVGPTRTRSNAVDRSSPSGAPSHAKDSAAVRASTVAKAGLSTWMSSVSRSRERAASRGSLAVVNVVIAPSSSAPAKVGVRGTDTDRGDAGGAVPCVVAPLEQQGYQSTADVNGRTSHQDLHVGLDSSTTY